MRRLKARIELFIHMVRTGHRNPRALRQFARSAWKYALTPEEWEEMTEITDATFRTPDVYIRLFATDAALATGTAGSSITYFQLHVPDETSDTA